MRKVFWKISQQLSWCEETTMNPTFIMCDSSAAISIATRYDISARTKHIDLRYYHIKDLLRKGVIKINKADTTLQLADALSQKFNRRYAYPVPQIYAHGNINYRGNWKIEFKLA